MPIFQTSLAPFDFNDFWGTKSTLTSMPQRVPLADTVLDWVVSSKEIMLDFAFDTKSKLLIILPGLTGSVKDGYIKEICYQALNKNYRPVVYNTRWLTTPVALPKEGYVDPLKDFIITMEFLKKNYSNYKMFAIGTSHGANLITKYLGTVGNETDLVGAVSVGNYFDLYASSRKCGGFWSYILAKILQMALQKQINEFRSLPKDLACLEVDKALSKKIITTHEFDELFSRRLLGYDSVEDYYRKFGCKEVLENVKRPLLCMQSLDDPICHYSEIPTEKCQINENLVFYISKKGGHCAWIQGIFNPSIFFPKPALDFLEALNKE
jgi:abhydrolase domain-containing protein 1/3